MRFCLFIGAIVFSMLILTSVGCAVEMERIPGVHGYVYGTTGAPLNNAVVNLTVYTYNVSDGSLIHVDRQSVTTGSGSGWADNYFYFTGDNAPYGVEEQRNVVAVSGYEGYQVGVNYSIYGRENFPDATIRLDIHGGYSRNLHLDVGNDSTPPWEWTWSGTFRNEEDTANLDPDKLNRILLFNCQCQGCVLNGSICHIPLRFTSDTPGRITIEDIYVKYWYTKVVESVDYNDTFSASEGADWNIEYSDETGAVSNYFTTQPDTYSGSDTEDYVSGDCDRPNPNNDSVDDAMWRLLHKIDSNDSSPNNCRLDKMELPEGKKVYFNASSMSFNVRNKPLTPQLWGPALVELMVWT